MTHILKITSDFTDLIIRHDTRNRLNWPGDLFLKILMKIKFDNILP